jgi:hypothetical protein
MVVIGIIIIKIILALVTAFLIIFNIIVVYKIYNDKKNIIRINEITNAYRKGYESRELFEKDIKELNLEEMKERW